jgi:DNA-binding NtrC family response regulator
VSERDIFYKVLIDLKKDVSELRKVVFGMLDTNDSNEESTERGKANFTRMLSNESKSSESNYSSTHSEHQEEEDDDVYEHVVIEDRDSVSEHEVLSLEAKEEELIRKALLKNNGRRKKAAKELGISERTLYRKIKQYEIES